jgi:hypothetical protein
LTVLFADLVGSTALSQALDAEDLRDVLHGYHDAVTAAIRDAGGFVAKFMGDGVLVYFGYPQASEDAAERAVTASLRAIAAVRELPGSTISSWPPGSESRRDPSWSARLSARASRARSTSLTRRPTWRPGCRAWRHPIRRC